MLCIIDQITRVFLSLKLFILKLIYKSQFRYYIIGSLKQLKRIDTVLISKKVIIIIIININIKERDNANVWIT